MSPITIRSSAPSLSLSPASDKSTSSSTMPASTDLWPRPRTIRSMNSAAVCSPSTSPAFSIAAEAAIGHMKANRYGRIVNIASIAGKEGNPNISAYSAAKAGVHRHSKASRASSRQRRHRQLRGAGDRRDRPLPGDDPSVHRRRRRTHPDGPVLHGGRDRDMVACAASQDCSFTTGFVFDVSGGRGPTENTDREHGSRTRRRDRGGPSGKSVRPSRPFLSRRRHGLAGHAFALAAHAQLLAGASMDWSGRYVPLAIKPGGLRDALRALHPLGFAGCNLTIPHKQTAMTIVDEVDEMARNIGATNCVVVRPDGSLFAPTTTAGARRRRSVEAAPGWRADAGPVVVIGAGGGGRAVVVTRAGAAPRKSASSTAPSNEPCGSRTKSAARSAPSPGRNVTSPRRRDDGRQRHQPGHGR